MADKQPAVAQRGCAAFGEWRLRSSIMRRARAAHRRGDGVCKTICAEPIVGATAASLVPDLIEPVIGYREWVVIGEELLSPLARMRWDAGPMRAECLARCRRAGGLWRQPSPHHGPAPDSDCVCGIYALFTPHDRRGRDPLALVRGAVVLWGRIEVHATAGMRAEFARIVALALPSPPSRPGPVIRVAQLLGVEAVPGEQLTQAAAAHGQPLPSSLMRASPA
jgi:hypothetical protein